MHPDNEKADSFAGNRWLNEFFGFLIHQLLAAILSPLITFVIVLMVGLIVLPLSASLYALVFKSLFSPFYWGAAVPIGFWFNRRMRNHSACWVWVFPTLTLSLLLVRYSVPVAEYYGRLLTCRNECLAAMFLTVPSMNCIAYSVGAWLALRLQGAQTLKARQNTNS